MRCYHGLFAVEAHYGEGDCPQFCVRGPSFLLGLWYNVDVKFECFVTEVPLFSSWPIFAWNGCQFVFFITEAPLFMAYLTLVMLLNLRCAVQVLREDQPTGLTPQRTERSFPRYLEATSPHQRILHRFRYISIFDCTYLYIPNGAGEQKMKKYMF